MAENLFAGYSNVSVHFVFTKLFHQITPYLIIIQVGVNFFYVHTQKCLEHMNACSDFVEPFLWNVDKRCMKLFCFDCNLIRALLNILNGHAHILLAMHACSDFVEHFPWNVDKWCMKLFCFKGNLIRALLNILNGRAFPEMAVVCACMHQFGYLFWLIIWCVLMFCLLKVISPEHSLLDVGRWDNLWWREGRDKMLF